MAQEKRLCFLANALDVVQLRFDLALASLILVELDGETVYLILDAGEQVK